MTPKTSSSRQTNQDSQNGARPLLTDRWQMIMDVVNANGGATIRDLCEQIGMSPNTCRRDLAALQQRGLVARTHGRIHPLQSLAQHERLTLAESKNLNPELKTAIGKAAAALIRPGETVLIDGGFTTYQVASHLAAADLHIATNSMDVANTLAARKDVEVTVIGGDLWRVTGSMIGWLAMDQISRINADKAVLGNDAVSIVEGLSCFNSEMSLIKRAMAARAKELIIVADHTKIGKFCKYTWADISKMTKLVTDSQIDSRTLSRLTGSGIEVVVAEV